MEHVAVTALFSIPHAQLLCDANPGLSFLDARQDQLILGLRPPLANGLLALLLPSNLEINPLRKNVHRFSLEDFGNQLDLCLSVN